MHTLPILLALLGCLRPEQDIDRTRIVGVVRVDPEVFEESSNNSNGNSMSPLEFEPLRYGYRIFQGTLSGFGATEEGAPSDEADSDCYALVSPIARGTSEEEDAPPPVTIDVTLADATARARVSVLNRDEPTGPANDPQASEVSFLDVTGWNALTVPLDAGVNYSLCIAGLAGSGEVAYDLVIDGQHPDEAGILVGLYETDDPAARGALYGGTDAQAFEPVDRWSFVARYEMLFVRQFEAATDDSGYALDENLKEGFVYAGNWKNLSQKLPAGTWYSSEPIHVDLTNPGDPEPWGVYDDELVEDTAVTDTGEDEVQIPPGTPTYPTVKVEDLVTVDAIAPVVIGQELAEVEPNDIGADLSGVLDVSNPDAAQDLGVLSGPGFVDIVTGAIRYDGNYGTWDADVDGFKFQVPAPSELLFTLDWTDPDADIDILISDAEGNTIDLGYFNKPEINEYGTGVLEPGQDYFIGILIYAAPAPGEVPWELRLEQLAP